MSGNVGTVTRVVVDPHSSTQTMPVVQGDLKMTVTTVVGAASYTTSGNGLTFAQLGLKNVLHSICTVIGSASNNTGALAKYDNVNQKLLMYTSVSAQVASTVNVSGNTVTITAWGY